MPKAPGNALLPQTSLMVRPTDGGIPETRGGLVGEGLSL